MTKHTPGPWNTVARGNLRARQYVEAGDFLIAEALTRDHEANARLIAAAPDLLAALQGLVDHAYRNNPEGLPYQLRDAVEVATNAIAKARGEV